MRRRCTAALLAALTAATLGACRRDTSPVEVVAPAGGPSEPPLPLEGTPQQWPPPERRQVDDPPPAAPLEGGEQGIPAPPPGAVPGSQPGQGQPLTAPPAIQQWPDGGSGERGPDR